MVLSFFATEVQVIVVKEALWSSSSHLGLTGCAVEVSDP
jgi:hypothetical protein